MRLYADLHCCPTQEIGSVGSGFNEKSDQISYCSTNPSELFSVSWNGCGMEVCCMEFWKLEGGHNGSATCCEAVADWSPDMSVKPSANWNTWSVFSAKFGSSTNCHPRELNTNNSPWEPYQKGKGYPVSPVLDCVPASLVLMDGPGSGWYWLAGLCKPGVTIN